MIELIIFIVAIIAAAILICLFIDGFKAMLVGDWRHLPLDNSWDASQSRGRIRK